jgi:adenosine deaminase
MTTTGADHEANVALCHLIPKVELHLHIEGTFEPELLFEIAKRNGIHLKHHTVDDLRAAYFFSNLQEFLDIYYQGMNALQTEQDYFDLTYAYFKRVHRDNVRHVELFFDPQGHTERGVKFETVVTGLERGMNAAKADFGITSFLILSFLRHLSEDDAFKTLEQAKPHLHRFVGVGLDSSEVGNPPEKFQRVYEECIKLGLRPVAHAGEEGDPSYIWGALEKLQVKRIDHGVRCVEDPRLLAHLVDKQIPLTVCPLSNLKLRVVNDMKDHNLKQMLSMGLCATINSDDPAYFGGYMTDNYLACFESLNLSTSDIIMLARNGVNAAFMPGEEKLRLHREISDVVAKVEKGHFKTVGGQIQTQA